MSLEAWKDIFELGGLILLALTVVFGGGALYVNKRLNREQSAQLRTFDKNLTDTRLELSRQQERTAKAERELLEERQQAANRDIPPEDQKAISEGLKKFPGQLANVEVFPVTSESESLAGQLLGILSSGTWNLLPPDPKLLSAPPIVRVQGVGIFSTPDARSTAAAKELFRLLSSTSAAGVLFPPPSPKTSRIGLPHPESHRVVVLIGDKPTPLRSWVKPITPDNTKSSPQK